MFYLSDDFWKALNSVYVSLLNVFLIPSIHRQREFFHLRRFPGLLLAVVVRLPAKLVRVDQQLWLLPPKALVSILVSTLSIGTPVTRVKTLNVTERSPLLNHTQHYLSNGHASQTSIGVLDLKAIVSDGS